MGLRIGKVTAVRYGEARVKYESADMTSGWLHTVSTSGTWTPEIDDVVLVVYPPDFNADGYIVGRISR